MWISEKQERLLIFIVENEGVIFWESFIKSLVVLWKNILS